MLLIRVQILNVEGTVSVVSSDPPYKDGNAWFTSEPLKALSDQEWNLYPCFRFLKVKTVYYRLQKVR